MLVGQDSIVGIGTQYRLNGLGIESQLGKIFHTHPDWSSSPPSILYNGHQVLFLKYNCRDVAMTTPHLPFSTKVKVRVELYL
jgi:hypothetical protein